MSEAGDFMARVQVKPGGCWQWIGGRLDPDGYGRLRVNGRLWKAHRYAYENTRGPIPDGLVIDHLCRNRACVNPDHMEPVTIAENVLRGLDALRARRLAEIDPARVQLRASRPTGSPVPASERTACPQGHPYSEENTAYERSGARRCRTCRRTQVREAQRRHRARALLESGGRRQ